MVVRNTIALTDHSFKNGIKIHLPDVPKEELLNRWTDAKMAISIFLMEHPKIEPKIRKPYTLTEKELKRRAIKFHKGQRKK